MSTVKEVKKRGMGSPDKTKSVQEGPATKRAKLQGEVTGAASAVAVLGAAGAGQAPGMSQGDAKASKVAMLMGAPRLPGSVGPGKPGVGAAGGVGGGLPAGIPVSGTLANMAATASLMSPLGVPNHPQLVGQPQILGQGPGFPQMPPGGHIKGFLEQMSLGQYTRVLTDNGCDTIDDLANADVQMLVNLGFKIFHANRLITAVHRIIRPPPPVLQTPTKRKRASHVRTFAEMYQRVEEFQNLVNQVGSMSAAERDPRSSISRGAYTQYLRIKAMAEKENIELTSEKYCSIKPTEKNVKEIIAKDRAAKMRGSADVAAMPANMGTVSQVGGVSGLS